ncbi:hypothetical protein [Lactococcus cremoris]|uniref:hypothetical protein n=1 Tax=Lactococcus lactis subsp. cremoris TaxID=1359 RepID=UPI0021822F6C|nr:hypothetical protein [Lactococcus cremoris]MCT0451919.1 hypothetical protein [Lactococcus cremoris]
MKIVASNSLTLSNISDGTGIANVTNFYLASNQSTGIEKPADVVNLIRNGAYPTNTNYWSGAMTVSQHNLYYNGQKKLFLLATTGPSEIVAASNRFDVKRNTNYSLSFYALAGGNVKDSDVFFLGRKSNETNDFTSANLIIGKRRFSGSKPEYVTITFNSGDNDNGYIRFDNNGSSDGINAVLYFGEVMLVEGGEPKPWVAAIEDSGWTRIPQQTTYANRFLWNYRIELYSDGVTKSIEPTVIGVYGEKGDPGKDGNPGKVVSDKEPTTKFVGLTWKYSGITAIDASNGTNIQPNTEYYWNGKNWVIYLINAQNINVEKLTALTANLGDATAGSLTVEKGATGGIAVKDGLVKSWDISKMTDPNYPDGYSYTSMGVALDSGGLTFYSAGYGHTLDKGGVIDSQYKVASLQAIASNGRNSIGTGFVLNATNSNFPFTINGNIDVIGGIRQTSKTASVTIGAGLILNLERRGDMVEATLSGSINSPLSSNVRFGVGTIPFGYRPNRTAYIMVHMTSSNNSAHIDVEPNGICTWWGTSYNSGAPRGHQLWFTNDSLQN